MTPLPSAPSLETCGSLEPETGYECELAKGHTGLHRAFINSFDEDGQVPERTWRAGAIVKSAADNRNTATEAVAPTQITAPRQQPAIAPSAPSPELTVGMHAIYTDRNGTRQSCIVRRIFAGYADVEFPSGRGMFEVALRRLAPSEALNKPWPADPSAPSPDEARQMNRSPVAWGIFDPKGVLCDVRQTLAGAEHFEREMRDIYAIFDENDELLPKGEFRIAPLFLKAGPSSDSRVVSPSAGARQRVEAWGVEQHGHIVRAHAEKHDAVHAAWEINGKGDVVSLYRAPSAGARMSEALRLIKAASLDARHWATEEAVSLSRIRLMNICDEALVGPSHPSTDTTEEGR